MKKLAMITLIAVVMAFLTSGSDTASPYGDYEPIGCVHTSLIVPETITNFETTDGRELCHIETTTGDFFVIEGELEVGKLYRVYRDDVGTPDMEDDVLITIDRML